jgi:exonuclease SbcC
MRLERVTAVAFGHLINETLQLTPALTVISGPNESGKSTWQAAIYGALCGMRRGRGRQRDADLDFARRHRPWRGERWEVHALIRLDDGRRIELRRNLADLVDYSVQDADLGRDVAGEIINEGAPDAARWLGLDRRSFLAVACVRQSEISAVADEAEQLQDELQRAAASTAREATASGAIAKLEAFCTEHVGLDRAHSTRPLRRAKHRLQTAERSLADARAWHQEWLKIETDAADHRARADAAATELRMWRALVAQKEGEEWRRKLQRARALASRFSSGPPPPLADEHALHTAVAAALSDWQNRPEVPVLAGPSAQELRSNLAALPPMPSGDLEPHADVVKSAKAYDRAQEAVKLHQSEPPAEPVAVNARGLPAEELRGLANELEQPIPTTDHDLERRYREAQAAVDQMASSKRRPLMLSLASGGVFAGVMLWVTTAVWLGLLLMIASVAALVWVALHPHEAARARSLERLRSIEVPLTMQQKAVNDALERRRRAQDKLAEHGLPPDISALRTLAAAVTSFDQQVAARTKWLEQEAALRTAAEDDREALMHVLDGRGAVVAGDVLAVYDEYERACRSRAATAATAARRGALEQQLSDREAAEEAVNSATARRDTAARAAIMLAERCGATAPDPKSAVEALRAWQAAHLAVVAQYDEATREHAELAALLGTGTLEDLQKQVDELGRYEVSLAEDVDRLPECPVDVDLAGEIAERERATQNAEREATTAETTCDRACSECAERGRGRGGIGGSSGRVPARISAFTDTEPDSRFLDRRRRPRAPRHRTCVGRRPAALAGRRNRRSLYRREGRSRNPGSPVTEQGGRLARGAVSLAWHGRASLLAAPHRYGRAPYHERGEVPLDSG